MIRVAVTDVRKNLLPVVTTGRRQILTRETIYFERAVDSLSATNSNKRKTVPQKAVKATQKIVKTIAVAVTNLRKSK